ncbi:hypothetical protein BC834DRAFT_865803 [Gloeopeniophorella convolvens]|nr:hypothetical protein BC834DRAFT_865803 [Gloeopeniophorella convolvens]
MDEADTPAVLSYDDDVAYEAQLPAAPSLAERIGRNKVYLLADADVVHDGKRKRDDDDDDADMNTDDVPSIRPNALLLQGPPIAHLSTSLISAYATHFDAHPLGLEWIDDTTCVLLFPSRSTARAAHALLQHSPDDLPDATGCVPAHPVPSTCWPTRLRAGAAAALEGALHLRWAGPDDVKQRGARARSTFYRQHGAPPPGAAQDAEAEEDEHAPAAKRRRAAELDDELDAFLREASPEPGASPGSPPSKMRADYIDGSLLARTSDMRVHPNDRDEPRGLEARLASPGATRRRPGARNNPDPGRRRRGQGREEVGGQSGRGRPRKSQQELDDELEAFLNERD